MEKSHRLIIRKSAICQVGKRNPPDIPSLFFCLFSSLDLSCLFAWFWSLSLTSFLLLEMEHIDQYSLPLGDEGMPNHPDHQTITAIAARISPRFQPLLLHLQKKHDCKKARDCFLLSPYEVAGTGGFSSEVFNDFLDELSSLLVFREPNSTSPFISALDLLSKHSNENTFPLQTGCQVLDEVVGGVLVPGVVEVVGESGVGKTQLGIQFLLGCLKANEKISSLYISTESLPLQRIQQVALSLSPPPSPPLLDRTFIERVSELTDLWKLLKQKATLLCRSRGVTLVLIDSIAAPVRNHFECPLQRAICLWQIAQYLKWMSEEFQVVIVVVNQVKDFFETDHAIPHSLLTPRNIGDSLKQPALGMLWACSITSRLLVTRSGSSSSSPSSSPLREIRVAFSPCVGQNSCHFSITNQGVKGAIAPSPSSPSYLPPSPDFPFPEM